MASWSVVFLPEAEQDLAALDRPLRRRIIDKIEWFSVYFEAIFPLVLHAEFKEYYKLRVGDWRVVYSADHQRKSITVSKISHRSKVYK